MEFFPPFLPGKVRLLGRFINTFIVFFPLLLLLLSRSEFREIKGEGEERLLAKLASATKVLRLSLSLPPPPSLPPLPHFARHSTYVEKVLAGKVRAYRVSSILSFVRLSRGGQHVAFFN